MKNIYHANINQKKIGVTVLLTNWIIFLYKFIYLFIFGCVGSSLLHAGFL